MHGQSSFYEFTTRLISHNFPEETLRKIQYVSFITYASIKRVICLSYRATNIRYGTRRDAKGKRRRMGSNAYFPSKFPIKWHLIWINARFLEGESEAQAGRWDRTKRGEAKRGARIYSAKSKPQRDRSHQVTNYFEFPSIKSKVACRPNEHESARLIEHRTYLELSRSAAIYRSRERRQRKRANVVC